MINLFVICECQQNPNFDWVGCCIELFGIIVSGFIAYHIYNLSKKISTKEELSNIKFLKDETKNIISEAYSSKYKRKKIIIIDVKQRDKYPDGGCIAGSIKDASYEGVEVFLPEIRKIYLNKHNRQTLKEKGNKFYCEVQVVGVIPYNWIEYIEPHGDEYNSCALRIFCRYKKYSPYIRFSFHKNFFKLKGLKYLFRINLRYFSPYSKLLYYRENSGYIEGKSHYWEQYLFFCEAKKLKDRKPRIKKVNNE